MEAGGILRKTLAKIFMKFMSMFNREIHISLGDQDIENGQMGHICFPLAQAVDRFVRTPPGEEPPPLGTFACGCSTALDNTLSLYCARLQVCV